MIQFTTFLSKEGIIMKNQILITKQWAAEKAP